MVGSMLAWRQARDLKFMLQDLSRDAPLEGIEKQALKAALVRAQAVEELLRVLEVSAHGMDVW